MHAFFSRCICRSIPCFDVLYITIHNRNTTYAIIHQVSQMTIWNQAKIPKLGAKQNLIEIEIQPTRQTFRTCFKLPPAFFQLDTFKGRRRVVSTSVKDKMC